MTNANRPLVHLNLAATFRGGERQTELLVRELSARGWRQRLVVRAGGALAARIADVPGLEVRAVRLGVAGAALALRGAGLVHVHEGRGIQAAWLAQVLAGVPYVVTRRSQKGPHLTATNRRLYGGATALVGLSRAVVTALRKLDPAFRVRVIPSASSGLVPRPGEPALLRAALGAGIPHPFLVGHVGALVDSDKGQMQIIELARRLEARFPDIRFVLVGDGPDEQAFRTQASGLANLLFAGPTPYVGDYLAAFDLFLFPSRYEGLGSILLDALAFGLPVVATRVGGIPEIVTDGENGTLCEPGDIDALERAVLSFHADPGLRACVGATNRDRAAGYSAAAMADRYEALYRELAAAGRCTLALPAAGAT